ncbi:MAG: protein kinase [Anaerolineales bacterium]|nr:protein kinase [Anaerolineales bacterium]
MSFVPGENVGPYRIIEQLGQGGMATVYKAYHAGLDRYVALKVLNMVFLNDLSFLARFEREARLLARLEHPNIVPIHDIAEQDGRPYLVMKFIEGETLKARLVKETLPPGQAAAILRAVGAALSFAHAQGILHRDVKPSNVLLEQGGQVYLADFGLARMAEGTTSTLTGDMVVGTPHYISPEQATGRTDLDHRTDIYSLGIMLYEMSVGRVPFDADTPIAVIRDHIQAPLPLPRSLNPDVSPDLERVLLKALAKQPEDRFANVESLVEAFCNAWGRMHAGRTGTPVLLARSGQRFSLPSTAAVLGRRGQVNPEPVDLDLSSLDSSKVVSRRHARIDSCGGGYTLTDLGSRNGTSLNGLRLDPNAPLPLQDGDEIVLGKEGVSLTFRIEDS